MTSPCGNTKSRARLGSWAGLAILGATHLTAAQAADGTYKVINGRPTVMVDGVPSELASYSPVGARRMALMKLQSGRFFSHHMGAYLVEFPGGKVPGDFNGNALWAGDQVSSTPVVGPMYSLDDVVGYILKGDPGAKIIIRFGLVEPKSWRALHPEDLFVNDDGATMPCPSLASKSWLDHAVAFEQALVHYCEARPWADHIIGYANFTRYEGGHEPTYSHYLYDHGAVMTARWREFLRAKYGTVERLRAAYGDPDLTFDNVAVPTYKLNGAARDVAASLYWQAPKDNQPQRDYLLLQRDLFHNMFTQIAAGMRGATERKRIFLYDALKGSMQGWSIAGFFNPDTPWPVAYPDIMAGSGNMDETDLMSVPGFDGLITPHDYQVRGSGGVFEPEGSVDSCILRGKLFFCEMDTRSYTGHDLFDPIGVAENDKEFAAITWRNWATAWSRGFNPYYMDLFTDWYASNGIQKTIARQIEVAKEVAGWRHQDVPGIAVVLDDNAPLETNGNALPLNEAVMWQVKMGLARCGVPYRIYQFNDLKLDNFPKHHLFYFPDLYRVSDDRLQVLKDKVFRDGNVVLWGPGSGISDGVTIGATSATKLTGFSFDTLGANYERRTQIDNFDSPVTADLDADATYGTGLAYGPVLYPKDGTSLGLAWTKLGKPFSGLSVKYLGKGPLGLAGAKPVLGAGDWASVFTTSVPIPAGIWRGLARLSGTHVYCDTNDVVVADSSVLGIHTVKAETKTLYLPGTYQVEDVVTGKIVANRTNKLVFAMDAPDTRVFHLVQRP